MFAGEHISRITRVTPAPTAVRLPSRSRSRITQCCVYTTGTPVPAIPVCSGILPVAERHDAESGAVSRPIAAACNDIAAMPRDREYALLAVPRDYHSGHSSSRQSRRTTGSRRSRVPRDSYRSRSRAKLYDVSAAEAAVYLASFLELLVQALVVHLHLLVVRKVNTRRDRLLNTRRQRDFYPRDAMPARVLAMALCLFVCLFVCLSVTTRCSIETAR